MRLDPEFQLIPVIDLKDSDVVHARAGKRDSYQPIEQHSNIVKESSIESVLNAFTQLFSFKTFYIADLNAITGHGDHHSLILTTLAKHADREFWIDDGKQQAQTLDNADNYKTVFGSEVQESDIQAMKDEQILSLDFMQGKFLGPASWFEHHRLWPKRIMIMNLDYVGSQNGPDFDTLSEFVVRYPDKQIFAAGGVRNNDDLYQLQETGVAGVLLASALHRNKINFDRL